MKHKIKKNGVEFTIDDGDDKTSNIIDISEHEDLNAEGNKQAVEFHIRGLKSQGFDIDLNKMTITKNEFYNKGEKKHE